MIRCIWTTASSCACWPPPGAPEPSSPCTAKITRRSAGASPPCWRTAAPDRNTMRGRGPSMVEREAAHRAIALAEMVDQPIQIFHVSCPEVADEIARAQRRGVKVWGEPVRNISCCRRDHMDRPGFEGAKFMCSPAPRDTAASEGLWDDVRRGTLDVISSDHSGWATTRRWASGCTATTRHSATSRTECQVWAPACRSCSARAWRRGASIRANSSA